MSELTVGTLSGLAANSYVIDVASGSRLTQPGMIVAVKNVVKTDTFSASVTSGASVDVTGLSITHELANPSNKLIITAFFGVAATSHGLGTVGIAVAEDGTLIGLGDADGTRTRVTAGNRFTGTTTFSYSNLHMTFVHTPGAGSKVYTVRAIELSDATRTLYINRNEDDTDNEYSPRSISSLILQEVAV